MFLNSYILEENSYWHKRVEVFIEYILSSFRKSIGKKFIGRRERQCRIVPLFFGQSHDFNSKRCI